jgi:hypothetical protein
MEAFADELFLLSFVSLLLLLSLLFELFVFVLEVLPDADEVAGFVDSFLIMLVGGEPSSCFIDVTISCSELPEIDVLGN